MSNYKKVEPGLFIRGEWYYAVDRSSGKPQWVSLHTRSLDEARRHIGDLAGGDLPGRVAALEKALISNGNGSSPPTVSPTRPSLEQAFKGYFASRHWDSNSTLSMYRSRSRRVVKVAGNDWAKFEELGPFKIWCAGGGNSIRNHVAALLRAFFDYCGEQNYLENPDKFALELKKLVKLKVRTGRLDNLPTSAEMEQLLAQVSSFDTFAGDFCRFLAYSGCRIGGGQTLSWSNVARDFSWVRVNEKGDKERTIPCNEKLAALLHRLHVLQTKDGVPPPPPRRVFAGATNRVKAIRTALSNAAKLLDSEVRTPHYLRHWFTSVAIMAGVPPKIVAGWLGHTDEGQVLRVYGHLCDRTSREMMLQLKL